jgi:hypothetical protein
MVGNGKNGDGNESNKMRGWLPRKMNETPRSARAFRAADRDVMSFRSRFTVTHSIEFS